jgi:hypothetical protein
MSDKDERRSIESRRIIGRVGQETEASMVNRVHNHMTGADADQNDWADVWGTRIGRSLGVILLLVLIYHLGSYFFAAS